MDGEERLALQAMREAAAILPEKKGVAFRHVCNTVILAALVGSMYASARAPLSPMKRTLLHTLNIGAAAALLSRSR